MKLIQKCEECLYNRQIELAKETMKPEDAENYIREIKKLMDNRKETDTSPYMVLLFRQVLRKMGYEVPSMAGVKAEYNQLMLGIEDEIEQRILKAKDPLERALVYARIGNYIDFGAMNHVDKAELLRLIEEKATEQLEQTAYAAFRKDCEQAKSFLILCDNCGEIVFDKLLLRQLKRTYPGMQLYAMVRGEEVQNDATMEDAIACGLEKEATIISNGNAAAGTVPELLSVEAADILNSADVVLSKGQGNYETLSGYSRRIYYTFLCKCDLFVTRFQVPRLTGMFVKEG